MAYIETRQIRQKALAEQLGIDATTLNFLNRHSKTLGGIVVARACTVIDLVCDGIVIGKIASAQEGRRVSDFFIGQLVLEFDDAFEVRGDSASPSVVLRRPAQREDGWRLSIRRVA